jgi:hypothetical protein
MKKILIFMLLPLVLTTACVDSLDDYNVSQKLAPTAPAVILVSNAIRNLSDVVTTPAVATNNFRLYIQQWATTTYTDEPRYNMTTRTIPQNWWQTLYRDVLADLKEARRILEADALMDANIKANQIAQIGILEVHAWSILVNTFGDVPYSKALDFTSPLPMYDDAATIYADLLVRLDASLAALKTNYGGLTTSSDILYTGNIQQWIKLGNSLKLKLALGIADVDNAKAKTLAEQAAPNVFTSNADRARVVYQATAPNNNPVSNNAVSPFTTRQDFVAGKTIVDKMNNQMDPRRRFYFTDVNGIFVGGNTGHPNTFATTSKPGTMITNPAFEALLFDYAEVQFMLAEAIERGYTVGGTAEEHYNAGIVASMTYWGAELGSPTKQKAIIVGVLEGGANYKMGDTLTVVTGTSAVATRFKVSGITADTITSVTILTPGEYSALPTKAPAGGYATVPTAKGIGSGARFNVIWDGGYSTYLARTDVAYTTAAGDYKQKIGEQKYLALNNRGYDAWTEWRRLDSPVLLPVSGGTAPAGLQIPVRLIYPVSEQTANGAAREAAAVAIGGDAASTKLFWDKF